MFPVPPWQLFALHQSRPFPFFMDRGVGGALSFAGSRPREQLVVERDGSARIWQGGSWHAGGHEPVECIADFIESRRGEAPDLPESLAGSALPRVVGYLSYELGEWTQ